MSISPEQMEHLYEQADRLRDERKDREMEKYYNAKSDAEKLNGRKRVDLTRGEDERFEELIDLGYLRIRNGVIFMTDKL